MKTIIAITIFLAGIANALAQDSSGIIRNVDVDGFKQAMDSLEDEVEKVSTGRPALR